MATQCYCCTVPVGTTTGAASGNQYDPVAVCEKCHSHVCDLHGQRDANQSYWRCVECLTVLVGASAARTSRRPTVVTRLVAHALVSPDLRYAYESLEEFVARNPPFEWVLDEAPDMWQAIEENAVQHAELAEAWEALDEAGRLMLAGAMVMVQHLDLGLNDVPEFLVLVGQAIGWDWPDDDGD